MGRLTRDPRWLREVLGATQTEKTARDVVEQQRLKMLMAARWMLVMIHFERELYRDSERDDLNDLWWGLVEQMQLIRRPEGRDEPDWAAKIHLSTSPVYYHNYLLGEWMASQLSAHLAELGGAGEGFLFDQRLGEFLSKRVFAHGAMLDWNALLVEAMGEGLNPRFFVDQFVAG